MHRTYSGLGDEQANRREGKVRYIEAILMDRDSTGIRVMGGESGGALYSRSPLNRSTKNGSWLAGAPGMWDCQFAPMKQWLPSPVSFA